MNYKKILFIHFIALFLLPLSMAAIGDDLVGAWIFDEASGNLLDQVASNDGTATATLTYLQAGKDIAAIDYDGSTARFAFTNAVFPSDASFTFAGWFNTNDTAFTLYGAQQAGGTAGYTIDYSVNGGGGKYSCSPVGFAGVSYTDTVGSGWQHIACVMDSTAHMLFINGVNVANGTGAITPLNAGLNVPNFGARHIAGAYDFYLDGLMDAWGFWDRSLSHAEISDLYSSGLQYPYTVAPPPTTAFATVEVKDFYDNQTLSGLTVYIGSGSNTTDATGLATVYDQTGLNFTVDGGSNYFNVSGTAIENATINTTTYGALVNVNASNIISSYLNNFTLIPDQTGFSNTTTTGSTKIYLKPNAMNNVSIYVYDGNYTYNSTEQTYINLTWQLNTTGQDVGSYEISGLYQSLMKVNVSLGTTTTYISNHTTNVSGNINYSEFTSTYNAYYPVLWNNYSLTTLPTDYSLAYKNVSIGAYNYTYNITIPAYALNSFYITLLDEITQAPITETMIVEVLTDNGATSYLTNNGSIAFEGLTPSGYTLRYRSNISTNYSERNYYQNLVNQNYYEITLYSILLSQSTPMVASVYDTSSNPIEGANVKLLRYYVSCNCYSVVEMRYTGASGDAYFVADAYDGNYKFSVDYQNITYFLSTSSENLIPDSNNLISKPITINLGTAYFQSYREVPEMGLQLVYNNVTKALSFSWNDVSGIVTQGCLHASYIDGIGYTDVAPACESASTGSVYLVLNDSVRSWKYYSTIETSTIYSEYVPHSGIIEELNNIWFQNTGYGAFLAALMTIALGLLFSFSAIGVVVVSIAGVVFMAALGLFSFGGSFAVGFATVVLGIALYLMRR